jgi:dephospho-CoA kinase
LKPKLQKKGVVIAIVGESGTGKTTSTKMIVDKGFHPIAVSDKLREEIYKVSDSPDRTEIQAFSKDMQIREGDDIFARLAIEDSVFFETQDIVVDGLRNIEERDYLAKVTRESGRNLVVVGIVSSSEIRFDRVVGRARTGDPVDKKKFDINDAWARGDSGSTTQQNILLIQNADKKIVNHGKLEDLMKALNDIIEEARNNISQNI